MNLLRDVRIFNRASRYFMVSVLFDASVCIRITHMSNRKNIKRSESSKDAILGYSALLLFLLVFVLVLWGVAAVTRLVLGA